MKGEKTNLVHFGGGMAKILRFLKKAKKEIEDQDFNGCSNGEKKHKG